VELYEHDPALNILEKIDPRRAGNLDAWLVPHRESESLLKQAQPTLDAIIVMAPKAVTAHPAAQSREVWLRFRGLPSPAGRMAAFFSESTIRARNSLPVCALP
jgi:hypothetical protein